MTGNGEFRLRLQVTRIVAWRVVVSRIPSLVSLCSETLSDIQLKYVSLFVRSDSK